MGRLELMEMMLTVQAIALAGLLLSDTTATRTRTDTMLLRVSPADTIVTRDTTTAGSVGGGKIPPILALSSTALSDTLPRRRASVVYSDAYGTRATIHRRSSYIMLPLFALSYFTGDKLFSEGSNASRTIINLHRASATAVTALFTVNTVTGGINMWQGRHDPIERKRKLLHSALFIAASAGFTYAGVKLANEAETSLDKRKQHRAVNLVSMGLSTVSVAIMTFGRD